MRIQIHKVTRARQGTLAVLFLAALIMPVLQERFHFAPSPELVELRPMAERPTWSWSRRVLDAFPARYEAYYNDAFGFRNLLTVTYNRMCYPAAGRK